MLDSVFGIVEDGGASRTTKTGIFVAIAIVIVAALFFGLLYMRYQRLVKQRTAERQSFLVRAGRLDLRRRCFDAEGRIRPALFKSEPEPTVSHVDGDSAQQQSQQDGDSDKGVKEKLMETITSGKLVHFLNNLQMKTKRLGQRFQPVLTPEQRLEAERSAQLHDESVNPLFKLRSGYMGNGASGQTDLASSASLSNSDVSVRDDNIADAQSEFDDESLQ